MKVNTITLLGMAGVLAVAPILGGCSRKQEYIPTSQPTSQRADQKSRGVEGEVGEFDNHILVVNARHEAAANKNLIERLRASEVQYVINGVGHGDYKAYSHFIEAMILDEGRHNELTGKDLNPSLGGAPDRMDLNNDGIVTGEEAAEYLTSYLDFAQFGRD